jgi:hypothetical protein
MSIYELFSAIQALWNYFFNEDLFISELFLTRKRTLHLSSVILY